MAALHTGNAGLQGEVFHSGVVVSVLLTSLCRSHLVPDTLPPSCVQTLKMEKKKAQTKVTVAFRLPRQLL